MLVVSRCVCGILNGNAGVMKSMMVEITDTTNRAQGFALGSMTWSVGSTIGYALRSLLYVSKN